MQAPGGTLIVGSICAVLLGVLLAWPVAAQQPATTVPPGKPVEIRVSAGQPPSPTVSITLGTRHGHATPQRLGLCHTGGGNTDVSQPSSDTVVITMTGVAVATGGPCCAGIAGMDFDLTQDIEVVFEKPDVKAAKLTVEARAIGLLRSHHQGGGVAEFTHGQVQISSPAGEIISLSMPDHSVAAGENLSINDHEGPVSVTIGAGKYAVCQMVHFLASHPKSILPCKSASAEFAPDPALDSLWISYWEPFHGAAKKDFGFQVTLKVAPDTEAAPESEPKKPEIVPTEPKKVGKGVNFQKPGQFGVERIRFEPRKVGGSIP
jgi:hypothetical protein